MKTAVTVVLLLAALCLPAAAGTSIAGETIGMVRFVSGDAAVTRGGISLQAAVGLKVVAGDTLVTGRDGSLGLILRDVQSPIRSRARKATSIKRSSQARTRWA